MFECGEYVVCIRDSGWYNVHPKWLPRFLKKSTGPKYGEISKVVGSYEDENGKWLEISTWTDADFHAESFKPIVSKTMEELVKLAAKPKKETIRYVTANSNTTKEHT